MGVFLFGMWTMFIIMVIGDLGTRDYKIECKGFPEVDYCEVIDKKEGVVSYFYKINKENKLLKAGIKK